MTVVLDTTELTSCPLRNKAAFGTIEDLGRAGLLKLVIPEVVRMEFESQEHGKVHDAIGRIASQLKKLGRSVAGKLCEGELHDSDHRFRKSVADAESQIRVEFEQWLQKINGVVIPYHADDLAQVMQLYARGSPPFAARRSRDDVPDGLVYVATRRIASESDSLTVFISRDGPLRKAASGTARLLCHQNLEEFLRSDIMQALIEEHSPTINFHKLVEILHAKPELIQATLASDLCAELQDSPISSDLIPDDSSEGLVQLVDDPYSVDLLVDNAWDYGDGRMGVPFQALVGADIGFYVFASDYWCMDERESKGISVSQHNDHYLDAEKHFVLNVKGTLVVHLDDERLALNDLAPSHLEAILDEAEIEIETVYDISIAEESPGAG